MKLKSKEILTTEKAELINKLKELKGELMKINSQIATGTMLKSPGNAKVIKKSIANILTVLESRVGGEERKG